MSSTLRTLASIVGLCGVIFNIAENHASGQACCAGGSAVAPSRLGRHDDALAGFQTRAYFELGNFDSTGKYRPNPDDASTVTLEENIFGTIRVFERGQVSLLVPFVESWRTLQNTTHAGGGLGDIQLHLRYDFTLAGEQAWIPGIAFIGALAFPTGTSPEASLTPTGTGAFTGLFGVAFEYVYRGWLWNGSVSYTRASPRTLGGLRTQLGSRWTFQTALAYSFANDSALGLNAGYILENDSSVDGIEVSASGQRLFTVSAVGLWPITDRWRLQGSLYLNPPMFNLGQNRPANTGLAASVLYAWM